MRSCLSGRRSSGSSERSSEASAGPGLRPRLIPQRPHFDLLCLASIDVGWTSLPLRAARRGAARGGRVHPRRTTVERERNNAWRLIAPASPFAHRSIETRVATAAPTDLPIRPRPPARSCPCCRGARSDAARPRTAAAARRVGSPPAGRAAPPPTAPTASARAGGCRKPRQIAGVLPSRAAAASPAPHRHRPFALRASPKAASVPPQVRKVLAVAPGDAGRIGQVGVQLRRADRPRSHPRRRHS